MDENHCWCVRFTSSLYNQEFHHNEDQIKLLNAGSTPHTYTLLLVPRRTTLCDRILEEEGVLGEVNISSYQLEFIPLEDDLVSLEWESVWREIYVVRIPFYRDLPITENSHVGWGRHINILRCTGAEYHTAGIWIIPTYFGQGGCCQGPGWPVSQIKTWSLIRQLLSRNWLTRYHVLGPNH